MQEAEEKENEEEDGEKGGEGRVWKNFREACLHYGFPGSHQVGSYGPKGKGIVRSYSNNTPGKDKVLRGGQIVLYRLKDERLRAQFVVNQTRDRAVRVFRKLSNGGVRDLGLFLVEGFQPVGPRDQADIFGSEFVRFSRVGS